MLTTLLPPTAGTARVGGFDVVQARAPRCAQTIGAALQEAALDPLLTGREHLRLQATLQALPRDRAPVTRADELLDRVGLDRGGRPEGEGLLGRDEAPARPRARARPPAAHPVPRRADDRARHPEPDGALGGGRRLARDDGVTVFLTTQYLEEADVLADRVGIIDHGHIVAEGTPAALKAEVGRPTVEAMPADPDDADRTAAILARFGEPSPATRASPCASEPAEADLAEVVRALDAEGLAIEPAPAPPALARRRVPREDGPLARGRGRRRGRPALGAVDGAGMSLVADQVYLLARRSVVRTLRQPANVIAPLIFPLMLLAVNSGGLKAETHLPGFPTTRSSPSRWPCRSSRAPCSRR